MKKIYPWLVFLHSMSEEQFYVAFKFLVVFLLLCSFFQVFVENFGKSS